MNHLDYIDFFENAAKKHNQIAHGQLRPNGKDTRQSFFRINDEEEMQTNLMNDASFPALSLLMYQGKLNAQDKALVRENLFGGFEIRNTVEDVGNYIAIEQARADSKKICEEVIALMLQESEKKCSIFKSLDVNSIRYVFTGPINTNQFGCLYLFNWVTNSETINNTDTAAVFSL